RRLPDDDRCGTTRWYDSAASGQVPALVSLSIRAGGPPRRGGAGDRADLRVARSRTARCGERPSDRDCDATPLATGPTDGQAGSRPLREVGSGRGTDPVAGDRGRAAGGVAHAVVAQCADPDQDA